MMGRQERNRPPADGKQTAGRRRRAQALAARRAGAAKKRAILVWVGSGTLAVLVGILAQAALRDKDPDRDRQPPQSKTGGDSGRQPRAAAETPRESPESELPRVPSIVWTERLCVRVSNAITLDQAELVRRITAKNKILAADSRLLDLLSACSASASDAALPASYGDPAEAHRMMRDVYLAWNSAREAMGLVPLQYGSISQDHESKLVESGRR